MVKIMKIMKKSIRQITAVIFCGIILAGCADNGNNITSGNNNGKSDIQKVQSTENDKEVQKDKNNENMGEKDKKQNEKQLKRAHYNMSLELITNDSIEKKEGLTEPFVLKGTCEIEFVNYSEDTWNQVCLRDYSTAMYPAETIKEFAGTDIEKKMMMSAVKEVKDGDNKLQYTVNNKDKTIVMIDLKNPVEPGATGKICVEFEELVACGSSRMSYNIFSSDRSNITVSLGPFYPVMPVYVNHKWATDRYFDDGECFYTKCADYDVRIKVPDEYKVISTGSEKNDDGTWTLKAENVRDFAIITGNRYEKKSIEVDDVTVNVWYPAGEDEYKKWADKMTGVASNAVKIFDNYFGKYPYDSLDVVAAVYEYGGMEYPQMVRIADVDAYMSNEYEELNSCMNVVHEIAHEWFYAVVGNDQYNEAWLDEGFARYCEILYKEESGMDKKIIDEEIKRRKRNYEETLFYPVTSNESQLGEKTKKNGEVVFISYGTVIYDGGAMFLLDLRNTMGKEKFQKFMKDWYSTNMFKEVTSKDFTDKLYEYDNSSKISDIVKKYTSKKDDLYLHH